MIRRCRIISALLCLAVLAGCGSAGSGPRDVTLSGALLQNLRGAFGPKAPPPSAAALRPQITPALLAQVSGALILVEIAGRGALMAEDGRNGAMVSYVDSGRIGLSLVDGIVVATRGLGNDLMTADVASTRARLKSGGQATRIHRRMTGENAIIATRFDCVLSRTGGQVTESCTSPTESFQNTYALDAGGRVAASRQWLGAGIGYVTIERIR